MCMFSFSFQFCNVVLFGKFSPTTGSDSGSDSECEEEVVVVTVLAVEVVVIVIKCRL